MCMTSLPHMFLLPHMFTTSLLHMFFTAARVLDLCRAVSCCVEHSRVEHLFVCTQKMKPLKKLVKPIRAVSFFVLFSWFCLKSVAQSSVQQSHFEQMIMTLCVLTLIPFVSLHYPLLRFESMSLAIGCSFTLVLKVSCEICCFCFSVNVEHLQAINRNV